MAALHQVYKSISRLRLTSLPDLVLYPSGGVAGECSTPVREEEETPGGADEHSKRWFSAMAARVSA